MPAARPTSRPKRLVRISEAAKYTTFCEKTIRRRIGDGTITGYRAGKRIILVDLDEVEARLLHVIPAAEPGDRAA